MFVLDCCDGTDESSGLCPNVCVETANAAFAAHSMSLKELREGAALKAQYIQTYVEV